MKKKLVGIFVMTLFIATAIPTIEAGDEVKKIVNYSSINNPSNFEIKEKAYAEQALDIEWNKTYGGPKYDMI